MTDLQNFINALSKTNVEFSKKRSGNTWVLLIPSNFIIISFDNLGNYYSINHSESYFN